MTDDLRCCGTGTCLINAEGLCWCGQQWDGEKMCFAGNTNTSENASLGAPLPAPPPSPSQPNRNS